MRETPIPTELSEVEQEFLETHQEYVYKTVIPRIREYAISNRLDSSRYSDLLDEAEGVIRDLTRAMNKHREEMTESEEHEKLWFSPTIENVINKPEEWRDVSPINAEDLDYAAAGYLRRRWMQSDMVDWILINAFIFDTLARWATGLYGLDPLSSCLGRLNRWFVGFWVSIGIVVLVLYFFEQRISALGIETLYGIAFTSLLVLFLIGALILIAFIGYGVYALISRRQRLVRLLWYGAPSGKVDSATVIGLLRMLYTVASHSTINPSRLREQLVAAEEQGVMITPAVYAILDRAIQRDPAMLTYRI